MLPRIGRGHAFEPAEIGNRVERGHLPIETTFFGKEPYCRGALLAGTLSEHFDPSACRPNDVEHHAQRRGLARAVSAKKAEDRPLLHVETKIIDCQHLVKTLTHTLQNQHAHYGPPRPVSRAILRLMCASAMKSRDAPQFRFDAVKMSAQPGVCNGSDEYINCLRRKWVVVSGDRRNTLPLSGEVMRWRRDDNGACSLRRRAQRFGIGGSVVKGSTSSAGFSARRRRRSLPT